MRRPNKVDLAIIAIFIAAATWLVATASPSVDVHLETAALFVMMALALRFRVMVDANAIARKLGVATPYGHMQLAIFVVGFALWISQGWLEIDGYALLVITAFTAFVLYLATSPSTPATAWKVTERRRVPWRR